MKSPITGEPMELVKEKRALEFRKEQFEIVYHFYRDAHTGEEFVSEATGNLNLQQVYNAYRAKHNLPFIEEIRQIRQQYDLPANTMSEILGFGVNQYRLYENGDIPSETNARMIQFARDPGEFLKLVKLSNVLKDKAEQKLQARIDALLREKDNWADVKNKVLGVHCPSSANGYRRTSYQKAYHMVRFFADQLKPLKTVMNKILFYSDFYHFKKHGTGISGLQYRAIQWGPVPSQFDYLFRMAEDSQVINLRYDVWGEEKNEMVFIEPNDQFAFRQNLFSDDELASMQFVLEKIGSLNTRALVNISHTEEGWAENIENKKIIDYQYAFYLKAL